MSLQTRMHKTHSVCPAQPVVFPGGLSRAPTARSRPPAPPEHDHPPDVGQWPPRRPGSNEGPADPRDPAFRSWVLKTAEKSRSTQMSDVSSSPPGLPGGPRRSLPPAGNADPRGEQATRLNLSDSSVSLPGVFSFFLCLGKGDLR